MQQIMILLSFTLNAANDDEKTEPVARYRIIGQVVERE